MTQETRATYYGYSVLFSKIKVPRRGWFVAKNGLMALRTAIIVSTIVLFNRNTIS